MYAAIYYLACALMTGEENCRQIHNGLNQVRKSNKPESVKLFIGPDGNDFSGFHTSWVRRQFE